MKPTFPGSRQAMTIAETLVVLAVLSMVMAALIAGILSVSASFASTDDYSRAQEDQLVLSDFLSMDLRRATNIVTTNSSSVLLQVEQPTYTDSPTLTAAGGVTYGTNPTVVTYTRNGSEIRRTETVGTNSVTIRVSRDVQDFDVVSTNTLAAGGFPVASNRIIFDPRFRYPRADYTNSRQLTAVQSYLLLRARKYQSDATSSNSVPVNP